MILTIICTDDSPAMKRQLERELEGIDYEVLNENDQSLAAKKAKGDFLLFLADGSAISKGSIKSSLMIFLNNMSDKRLAAITPVVDFDDVDDLYIPTIQGNKWRLCKPGSRGVHPVRTTMLHGAILRKASFVRALADTRNLGSLGVELWDYKLRILCNPDFVYYSPLLYRDEAVDDDMITVPELVKQTWAKEHIVK